MKQTWIDTTTRTGEVLDANGRVIAVKLGAFQPYGATPAWHGNTRGYVSLSAAGYEFWEEVA